MAARHHACEGYVERASEKELRDIFEKYASIGENGHRYMTDEDFVVKYLKLLPEKNYNVETLSLLAGVIDMNKDDRISFSEFSAFEAHLCYPDALYRTTFQLFDTNGGGPVSYSEFVDIISKTSLHKHIPFNLEGSFVKLYFGKDKDHEVSFREFCQFLHEYHDKYSKYAFKSYDLDGDGFISSDEFCDIMFTIKNHLLTKTVKKVFHEFICESEGTKLSFAYCTAFRAMLTNMEEMKKIYLQASKGSKTREISKDIFLHTAQEVSQATPLEIDILFRLSEKLHDSKTIIYSDLQDMAPEQYMKKVTKRLLDIKMVESPEDRTTMIELLESAYRFCVGSLSGLLGAGFVYPVDLVKTRMMNQRVNTELLSKKHAYADTLDCFKKVLKYEGLHGLYRGLLLHLAYVAPEKAIKLATNDFVRDRILTVNHGHISIWGEMLAGAFAGMSNVIFSNPLEIVKIRLQVAGTYSTLYTESAITVFKKLGFSHLYKGATACMLRDVPFATIYFPAYAHIKPLLADDTGYNSPLSIFIAGALAGAPAASLVTPIDLIKTRLQVVRRPGQAQYNGIVDCAYKIYHQEGVKAFWKGSVANKLRSSPQFGITLVAYELIQRVLYIDFGGSKPSGSFREIPKGSANLVSSSNPDHIGGYALARPIFVGMESKFGLFFPKFQHETKF